MWNQKKGAGYPPPMYGQSPSAPGLPAGHQMPPQPPMQQPYQSLQQPYHTMAGPMPGHQLAAGLGPPPPYTPYAEPSQQQVKYMPQMAYNPGQYMPTSSASLPGAPLVPPPQVSMAGAHSYGPNPYGASHPYQNPGLYPYNPYPSIPPNSTVVMPHGFDAGARFDGVSRPLIPPPPPGVAPNAAQMAAMQGHNVVIGQKKGSFLEGGSSGGYTFW